MSQPGANELEVPAPDVIRVQRDHGEPWRPLHESGVSVTTSPRGSGRLVQVMADARGSGSVSRVHLRWYRDAPARSQILGDAWERSYGDLAWRGLRPDRALPWAVLVHDMGTDVTWGAGVEVRASAFAAWSVDPRGVSLWLDLRSGGLPVQLGHRTLDAAVVRWVQGSERPFLIQQDLWSALSPAARPSGPLVGVNNWYYAYGRGFDADAVVCDARLLADLVESHPVRPFGVVDDGWTPDGTADGRRASGGPWRAGRPSTFPDMAEVAGRIRAEDVRPGIWFRPLLSRVEPVAGALRSRDETWALDPSHPETLDTVTRDVAQLRDWGFELLKHDFSTFDALDRWGFQMGASPAADDVALFDRTRTTAEVLVGLYTTIREAAGDDVVVLGCNTVGHLAAGLVEAQRTGDDTSGRSWDRTRRMGVNTLAFRIAQHGRLFVVDADCVPSTPSTPWRQNRQLLDLVARSGTALFVSVDPGTRTDAIDDDLSAALRLALDGGAPGGAEPLDWLDDATPSRWRTGGERVEYSWYEDVGADVFGNS